jgi:hypothetical protein
MLERRAGERLRRALREILLGNPAKIATQKGLLQTRVRLCARAARGDVAFDERAPFLGARSGVPFEIAQQCGQESRRLTAGDAAMIECQ